jgi:hypothetical protein
MDNAHLEPCPCCGYRVGLTTYDICPVCFWEHDPVQFDDPDYPSGANRISLREAQRNFVEFGACERLLIGHVDRKRYTRDPNWQPLNGK